jgi:hypothetical protein
VFLGAMALLGLVGLLRHRDCPGILSVRPRATVTPSTPRGTQTRRHPTGAWRVVVRGMIWRAPKGCQTTDPGIEAPGRERAASSAGWRSSRGAGAAGAAPHEYSPVVCRNRLATPSAPVLSSPGPRRRDVRGRSSRRPRKWPWQRVIRPWMRVDGRFADPGFSDSGRDRRYFIDRH